MEPPFGRKTPSEQRAKLAPSWKTKTMRANGEPATPMASPGLETRSAAKLELGGESLPSWWLGKRATNNRARRVRCQRSSKALRFKTSSASGPPGFERGQSAANQSWPQTGLNEGPTRTVNYVRRRHAHPSRPRPLLRRLAFSSARSTGAADWLPGWLAGSSGRSHECGNNKFNITKRAATKHNARAR